LLTPSGLTYPEVSSKVYHDSFCQLGDSISLPWVIYFEAFCLHVVFTVSCIPVICSNATSIVERSYPDLRVVSFYWGWGWVGLGMGMGWGWGLDGQQFINLSHKHYFIDGSGLVHQNTGLTPRTMLMFG